MGYSIHFIIKIISCYDHPFMSIHIGQKYLHILCSFKEVYPHTFSQDLLLNNLSIVFFQVPHHSTKSLATAHVDNCIDSYLWSCLLPGKISQQGNYWKNLLTGRIFLYQCPSGVSQKVALVMQLSTFRWCLNIMQNYL